MALHHRRMEKRSPKSGLIYPQIHASRNHFLWRFRTDDALPLFHIATGTDPELLDPLLHVSLTPLLSMHLIEHPRDAFMAFPLLT
jgi:hypothetical protein